MGRTFSGRARVVLSRVLVGAAVVVATLINARCWAADESLPTPPQTESTPSKLTAVPPQTNSAVGPSEPSPNPAPQGSGNSEPQFKARYKTVPGMPSRMQYGGAVFEESYFQGLQQPMRSQIEMGGMPQATGWTDYGFPSRPFRWGYFGAEPRRDRTSWRHKYYGEKQKTKYYYGLK